MVFNHRLLLSRKEALYLIAKDVSCLLLKMPITVLTCSLKYCGFEEIFNR